MRIFSGTELTFALLMVIGFLGFWHWRLIRKVKNLSRLLPKRVESLSVTQIFTETENNLQEQQKEFLRITEAIKKIGDGEDVLRNAVSHGEAENALLSLQEKLKAIRQEESIRIWASQGVDKMGRIRKNDLSMSDYSFEVISQLVKYVDAHQGAFYVLIDDGAHQCLELFSAYAYSRRKFQNERVTINIGDGLVGQCALERQMIHITEVPKDYIKITSGLGSALPRCISIMPLVFRDEVLGVIELASFAAFEKYQLEFIQRVCDGIAFELSGIRSQERTRKLLEQSQEEELRQTLKEMQVAQQEMLRKEEELNDQLVATHKAMALAESEQKKNKAILEGCMDAVISFSEDGSVEYFNKAAEEMFGYDREDVIGTPVEKLLNILIEKNDDNTALIRSAQGNEVNIRTEINVLNAYGEELALLLTATKVQLGSHQLFTLFAQKVSVDLF